jgi:phosphoadenylyl-sulfate reductase (thioredoxin)
MFKQTKKNLKTELLFWQTLNRGCVYKLYPGHPGRTEALGCGLTKEEIIERKAILYPLIRKVDESLLENRITQCNSRIFNKFRVKQAKEIIKEANEIFSGKLPLAFSGGKDSLVILHMALDINPDIPVIYNNTTVEFPETLQYVNQLKEEWSINLHMTKNDCSFFQATKEKGWATHENRWCCKPFKEEPAYQFMVQSGYNAEITGTTRTESIYRRSLRPIKMPNKNPMIIRVNPIYDWNEWEVWRYIKENSIPHNPLYEQGYRRIGCWCCPLNGPSHYRRLARTHPKLYSFLNSFEPLHPSLKITTGVQT